MYAVSCPDVAEHTAHCGNLPAHPHLHHPFDLTGDPRFIGISEAVPEELDSSCASIGNSSAAVAMTGSSYTDARPYPLSSRTIVPASAMMTSESAGVIGRNNLNNHMAQSHPHLYAASTINNSNPHPTCPGMETCTAGSCSTGGPLFYSQQELQQFQKFQHAKVHQSHYQQQQPPTGMALRSGSSRSSQHSRSYQNLPCSTQHNQQQQYGPGAGANQHFNPSTSQQQLYNNRQQVLMQN